MAMQIFYNQLVKNPTGENPYLACLVRLTRVGLEQLTLLKSDLAWFPW